MLHNQRMELLGGGSGEAIIVHLPLANHVHDFNAGKNDARPSEILKAHHRLDDAFDGAVILLDDIIQVLVPADLDRSGYRKVSRGLFNLRVALPPAA
jgi:hypothetical protein